MIKSKTFIDKQTERKTNPELVETIMLAKKNAKWIEVAGILSGPRKFHSALNLDRIDRETKEGDTIVVPGKVLSSGNITKKLRIVALSFSEEARKKLKEYKSEVITINEEIKKNPKMQGVKVLRW